MSLDRVALIFKVGDQVTAGASYLGLKDGMPICYIDEAEWGLSLDDILSSNMYRVFSCVQVNRKLLPKIKTWLSPVGVSILTGMDGGQIIKPAEYAERPVVLPFADLEKATGITDLEMKLRSRDDVVPLINGTLIGEEAFRDAKLFMSEKPIEDLNAISSGSYTVGASQNYATWALFGADLTTLVGNLTGTQKTAITETAICNINIALAGYALTLTSDTNPLGNFGAGWLITANMALIQYGVFEIACSSAVAGGKINISKLNVKKGTGAITTYGCLLDMLTATSNISYNISDSIFNGNGLDLINVRSYAGNPVTPINIFNCVSVNAVGGASGYGVGFVFASPTSLVMENCTAYGNTGATAAKTGGMWNYSNSALTFKNNASFGNTKDYTYATTSALGLGGTTASKCASSDSSGSEAGLRSLTAANQFQSLTLADGDPFLKLKVGSALLGAGAAPGIAANTYGIRGNKRPHGALYSIGADEWKVKGFGNMERGLERALSRRV